MWIEWCFIVADALIGGGLLKTSWQKKLWSTLGLEGWRWHNGSYVLQVCIKPAGILTNINTKMVGKDYWLSSLIMQPNLCGTSIPLLLGQPWLYQTRVKTNWYKGTFLVGKGMIVLCYNSITTSKTCNLLRQWWFKGKIKGIIGENFWF